MLEAILSAVISVTAIGIICAVMLVVAAKFMSVPENEKVKKIRECLPGANCGACGYTGCDGYAKALGEEEGVKTNLCIPAEIKHQKTFPIFWALNLKTLSNRLQPCAAAATATQQAKKLNTRVFRAVKRQE